MTPSTLLLIICLSLFIILTAIFISYFIQVYIKERKGFHKSASIPIASFSQSGKADKKTVNEVLPQYRLAKAK